MKKLLTLISVAAAFGLPAFAQSSSPTPAPSPTPYVSPESLLSGSAQPLQAAHDWPDLIALGNSVITSSTFIFTPDQTLTDAQIANNQAIQLVESATSAAVGKAAGLAYALSKNDYLGAASIDGYAMHQWAQAVVYSGSALALIGSNTYFQAQNLFYRVEAGQAGNADILNLLSNLAPQNNQLDPGTANFLYTAWNSSPTGNPANDEATTEAFLRDLRLRVESNNPTSPFVAKLINQLNKLNPPNPTPSTTGS